MAQLVTAFAQRYGAGGSFWQANPQLPYLPVQSFEIGNEPNLPTKWVVDNAHMHWDDPAAYAQVYVAARAALHEVDPSAKAVVGGLADSATGGVDLASDERWLAALPSGGVDAVGYHSWVFDVSDSLLETDTAALRTWMVGNGLGQVPLDVTEFGACQITSQTTDNNLCPLSQSSATWGSAAASYAQWALCTPSLHVENVQPFSWGGTATTDQDVFLSLFTSNLSMTPYGQAYFAEVKTLTTTGCPPASPGTGGSGTGGSSTSGSGTSGSGTSGSGTSGSGTTQQFRSMNLRVVRVTRRGFLVSVIVAVRAGSGRVIVTGSGRRRGHRFRQMQSRRRKPRTITFIAQLSSGRWTVTVTGRSASGYAKPSPKRLKLMVPRPR